MTASPLSIEHVPIGALRPDACVSSGRFAWEQAARLWPPDLLAELSERLVDE